MEQMHEISFEQISDGSIRLEQLSGHDERDVIILHPEQLRFIARRMAGMKPDTAALVEDLERKLSVITDRLEHLVTDNWFRKGIINECSDGIEMMAKLDGLVDLCVEMDGGRLLPSESKPEPQKAIMGGSIDKLSPNMPDSKENAATSKQKGQACASDGIQLGLAV